jgi:hypothetical protein
MRQQGRARKPAAGTLEGERVGEGVTGREGVESTSSKVKVKI